MRVGVAGSLSIEVCAFVRGAAVRACACGGRERAGRECKRVVAKLSHDMRTCAPLSYC